MKTHRHRVIRCIAAIFAAESAWWLCGLAGLWANGTKTFASFAVFALCVVGLNRLYTAMIDLLLIAATPTRQPVVTKT
jgi:hypothetical protein